MTGPPKLPTFRRPCRQEEEGATRFWCCRHPPSPAQTSPCRQRRGVDQQNMSAYCECAADRRVVLPKTGEAFNIGIRSISFPHYHSRSRLLAHKLPSHISLLRYFIQTRSNRIGKYIPSPAIGTYIPSPATTSWWCKCGIVRFSKEDDDDDYDEAPLYATTTAAVGR